jgi:hypothetical protein
VRTRISVGGRGVIPATSGKSAYTLNSKSWPRDATRIQTLIWRSAFNSLTWGGLLKALDDEAVILLLLAGWVAWRRPLLSSVPMGLALATRQESWFFAPFFVVLAWRYWGWSGAVPLYPCDGFGLCVPQWPQRSQGSVASR